MQEKRNWIEVSNINRSMDATILPVLRFESSRFSINDLPREMRSTSIHPTIPFEQHLPSLHYPVRNRVYPWGRSSFREFLPSRTNGSRVALIRHNVSSLFFFFSPLRYLANANTALSAVKQSFPWESSGRQKASHSPEKDKMDKKKERKGERGARRVKNAYAGFLRGD